MVSPENPPLFQTNSPFTFSGVNMPRVEETYFNVEQIVAAQQRDLIRTIVEQNQDFANTNGLYNSILFAEQRYFGKGDGSVLLGLVEQNRQDIFTRLYKKPFKDAFGVNVETWKVTRTGTAASDALTRYNRIQQVLAEDSTFDARDFTRFSRQIDLRKNIVNSPIDQVMRAIIDEPTEQKKFLEITENVQKQLSEANLSAIDSSDQNNEDPVKKDLVIVGGGPATALLVRLLSPYYTITVITDKDCVGQDWIGKSMYFNSPDRTMDPNAPRIPFIENSSSSPLLPFGVVDGIFDESPDVKEVVCDDGATVRRYGSGNYFGAKIAANIAMNCGDYIVGQKVKPIFSDGDQVVLELSDVKSDQRRYILANQVIFATGPGKEAYTIGQNGQKDFRGEELYNESRKVVSFIAQYLNESSPEELKEAVQTVRSLERKSDTPVSFFPLPRILSREMLETLDYPWYKRDMWTQYQDLFPLKELFRADCKIAVVGFKDTGKANIVDRLRKTAGRKGSNAFPIAEFAFGGPIDSYPFNYSKLEEPQITVYGKEFSTPEEYARGERKRYQDSVGTKTRGLDRKVFALRRNPKTSKILVFDDQGEYREYDYVFVATGLEKQSLNTQFPFPMEPLEDRLQDQVGLVNETGNVYLTGAGARGSITFPEGIQRIFDVITDTQSEGGQNNRVALWIWQALTERLGFELAQKAFNRPRFLEAMKQRQERVNTTILKRVNPLLVQQPQ